MIGATVWAARDRPRCASAAADRARCGSGVEEGVLDAFADPVERTVLAPSEGVGCELDLFVSEVGVDDASGVFVGQVLFEIAGLADLGDDLDEGLVVTLVRRLQELGGTGRGGCRVG